MSNGLIRVTFPYIISHAMDGRFTVFVGINRLLDRVTGRVAD